MQECESRGRTLPQRVPDALRTSPAIGSQRSLSRTARQTLEVRYSFEDYGASLDPGTVVIIGEVHGTSEFPAAVERIARAVAGPVHLGVEFSAASQAALDRYLDTAGAKDEQARLRAVDPWPDRGGRATHAMFGLVDAWRQLRQQGRDVAISAFSLAPGDPVSSATRNTDRDRVMADRLADRIDAHDGYVHLVLCGDLHAQVRGPSPARAFESSFVPMAALLDRRLDLVAIRGTHRGGTSWNLYGTGRGDRTLRLVDERGGVDLGDREFIDDTPHTDPRRAALRRHDHRITTGDRRGLDLK